MGNVRARADVRIPLAASMYKTYGYLVQDFGHTPSFSTMRPAVPQISRKAHPRAHANMHVSTAPLTRVKQI